MAFVISLLNAANSFGRLPSRRIYGVCGIIFFFASSVIFGIIAFSPRTFSVTCDSPSVTVITGLSPRSSPINAAPAESRPDLLTYSRVYDTKWSSVHESHSFINEIMSSEEIPLPAFLAASITG